MTHGQKKRKKNTFKSPHTLTRFQKTPTIINIYYIRVAAAATSLIIVMN